VGSWGPRGSLSGVMVNSSWRVFCATVDRVCMSVYVPCGVVVVSVGPGVVSLM
jgi:hypothetical protein